MRLPDSQRSRIVLIGTSEYEDENLPDLPAVGRNIIGLKTALTNPVFGIVPKMHCDVLADEGDIRLIGRRVRIAARQAEDLLLVYYAGHGLTAGRRHELYLALRHTEWDEPEFNALEYDKLRGAVLNSPAAAKIIILDCCFSGRVFGHSMAVPTAELIDQVDIDGSYVMASAHGNEVALVLPGEDHTAFTGRLLKLLHDGVHGGPEFLTVDYLYQQLRAKMRAEGLPQPQKRGTDTADLLALTRNRAFDAMESPIPRDRQPVIVEPRDNGDRETGTVPQRPLSVTGRREAKVWRIGLWGAPASGKTTFLAALNVAVTRSPQTTMIYGADDESTEFLKVNTKLLTSEHTFPVATFTRMPLRWVMKTQAAVATSYTHSKEASQKRWGESRFELIDPPGGLFSPARAGPFTSRLDLDLDSKDGVIPDNDLINYLVNCDGIVLLFDPIREQQVGDSYDYFEEVLLTIAQRRFAQEGENGNKLPHHLAVCVTKFDDPLVYARAKTGNYCEHDADDPFIFPRVKVDKAEAFFVDLCQQSEIGNADLLPPTIRRYFSQDRTRYFVTSSTGFYLNSKTKRFDEQDYQNVMATEGIVRIRGSIHPINVVEPFLWLDECLTKLND